MTHAATFGRRGAAAPPPVRHSQARPAAGAPARTAAPAKQAAPKAADDSLIGFFVRLLFGFEGRLDRRTYRYARIVANTSFALAVAGINTELPKFGGQPGMELLLVLLMATVLGVMAWTTLAMQVKRRHDRDKGWAWLFVGFIPIAGPIWVLVETCWLDGTPGYNRFDDPTKVAAATFA